MKRGQNVLEFNLAASRDRSASKSPGDFLLPEGYDSRPSRLSTRPETAPSQLPRPKAKFLIAQESDLKSLEKYEPGADLLELLERSRRRSSEKRQSLLGRFRQTSTYRSLEHHK